MLQYAPIAVFVYRRPDHTRKMIDSLAGNPEFSKSPVYVFSDGPRSPEVAKVVDETRKVVRSVSHGNIRIKENDSNQGLASSISSGVSEICERHGRIIVIEDDLIVSRYFLEYMNAALCKYENNEKVMHVAGYMYPVREKLPGTFFFRNSSSWGWATWQRAWSKFEPDPRKLISDIEKNEGLAAKFNIDNSIDYLGMLKAQAKGQIDSWGIRWDASVLLNDGLCLYPGKSLVRNIGHDGSGIHSGIDDRFDTEIYDERISSFCDDISENQEALEAIKRFYKKTRRSLCRRVTDKIIKMLR